MADRNPHYRIDPLDLRLFAAVAEAGTITAGARGVHLSLAAASARLKALEHAVGVLLMQRAKTGVTLTDAGRTLLRHAGRLQRDMEALHAGMAAHAHGVRATVRLLGNTAAISEHLPPLLGPFLTAHPQIDIELRELDSQDVLFAMRQERAELGIVADYVTTTGLTTRTFREDGLVAVLPAALQQGRGLHHRVQVPGFDALLRLVADGVGVAVVPAMTARRLADSRVRVRPLSDAWATRQLLVCFSSAEALSPGAAALLDALVVQ
jgi:molybdate transport repressor ModE-like protein